MTIRDPLRAATGGAPRVAILGAILVAFLAAGGCSTPASGDAKANPGVSAGPGDAEPERAAIARTLGAYKAALDASDTAAVVALYAEDGIFMAPFSRSAVGPASVRKAYDDVFAKLRFDVRFDVAEIVQVAPTWAFVRTNSAGTTTVRATGLVQSEGNQELFVLKKESDGRWRIARYSFSPTGRGAA